MSKEYLEAFHKIMETYGNTNSLEGTYDNFLAIKKALQRLEQIENANPSEALKDLEHIKKDNFNMMIATYPPLPAYNGVTKSEMFDKIEQSLIKAQEDEKVLNEIIKLINDLEPTLNHKRVSSDTDILGTIIRDYFIDNASDLLKDYFNKKDKGE